MKKQEIDLNILYWIIAALVLVIILGLWYCLGKEANNTSNNDNNVENTKDTPLVLESERIWLNKKELKKCIANWDKYTQKINSQQKLGSETFGVTWTPWSILVNNETGEYKLISWAYPKEAFISAIDKLLSDEIEDIKEDDSNKKDFIENTQENTLVIISDKRDDSSPIEQLIMGLRQSESISEMIIEEYDFSDNNVKEYLEENNINALPAVIFSKESTGDENIDEFLSKISESAYFLNIWAQFNPFDEMSPKWFKMVELKTLEEIKKNSYIDWNKNAKITWLEYSDLECPFCAKLHNSDVESSLKEKYGNDLNIVFNHFPLEFHKKAIPWAQILECVWEQGWSEAFYSILRYAFKNEIVE